MADEPTQQLLDLTQLIAEVSTTYESDRCDLAGVYVEILRSTMTVAADTPDALTPLIMRTVYREFPANPFV